MLHFASRILPTIGSDDWESEAGDDNSVWEGRAVRRMYSALVRSYSHLFSDFEANKVIADVSTSHIHYRLLSFTAYVVILIIGGSRSLMTL